MSSTKKRTYLSFEDKNRFVQFLLANFNQLPGPDIPGVLSVPFDPYVAARGKITEAASMFNVDRQTIKYIWGCSKYR